MNNVMEFTGIGDTQDEAIDHALANVIFDVRKKYWENTRAKEIEFTFIVKYVIGSCRLYREPAEYMHNGWDSRTSTDYEATLEVTLIKPEANENP